MAAREGRGGRDGNGCTSLDTAGSVRHVKVAGVLRGIMRKRGSRYGAHSLGMC